MAYVISVFALFGAIGWSAVSLITAIVFSLSGRVKTNLGLFVGLVITVVAWGGFLITWDWR